MTTRDYSQGDYVDYLEFMCSTLYGTIIVMMGLFRGIVELLKIDFLG